MTASWRDEPHGPTATQLRQRVLGRLARGNGSGMVSAVASRGSDSWSPWSAPLARADGAERDPSQPIAPESGIVSADADRHDPDGVKH